MNIVLISSICSDLGICTIAPVLKKEGHDVRLLFVPDLLRDCLNSLSGRLKEAIGDFVRKADLVGINGLSENYHKTTDLVRNIKQSADAPLIWGGIHATLKPEECLRCADMVCVGEGEEALLELVRRMEKGEGVKNIRNILSQDEADEMKNLKLRPPVELDSLPPLDYDFNSQYITEGSRIRNLRESDAKGLFYAYTSRGCPFRCSYCCNAAVAGIYAGQNFTRQRNIENALTELKDIKRRFSSCREIWFNEADFLSGKTQEVIDSFSNRYEKEIGIPFTVWSHPAAVTEDNIRSLKKVGLKRINIGTITGSENIQRKIYNRNAPAGLYERKGQILDKYKILTEYDIILCNPYETAEDVLATIKLLMKIPKPCKIVLHYLTYFRKTGLYDMALKDGVIDKDVYVGGYTKAAYKVWKSRDKTAYLNIVLSLMRGWARRIDFPGLTYYGIFMPEPVLRFLTRRNIIKFFGSLPLRSVIYAGIANVIMVGNRIGERLSCSIRRFLLLLRRTG